MHSHLDSAPPPSATPTPAELVPPLNSAALDEIVEACHLLVLLDEPHESLLTLDIAPLFFSGLQRLEDRRLEAQLELQRASKLLAEMERSVQIQQRVEEYVLAYPDTPC